jgi:hypothetical protein
MPAGAAPAPALAGRWRRRSRPQAAHRQGDELGVAEADGAGVQIAAAGFGPEQAVDQLGIAADGLEAMAHGALDAGAGKAGVAGVALALDGVVDDADGLPGAHVHGADGVEEQG